MTPSSPGAVRALAPARLAIAAGCLLLYALPLFVPPRSLPLGTATPADAWLFTRIFPGVPALWVAVRVGALAIGAWLLSGAPVVVHWSRPAAPRSVPATRRAAALAVAVLHAAAAPWAAELGPGGQALYLGLLLVPAALLAGARPKDDRPRAAFVGSSGAVLVVIAVWVAARLATDVGSPRVADVIDGWRGFLDIVNFVEQRKNLLIELFDPRLPGAGAIFYLFHGMPLFQSDALTFSFRTEQVFQIFAIALAGLGVGVLTRQLIGRGAAPVAVAVLLFSAYVRFVTIFPGPFIAGPLYAIAIGLAAVAAARDRSEAGLAALGALFGVAVTYPGVVPIAGAVVAATLWTLRNDWRRLWVGAAAGLASFAAVVIPALPKVLTPDRMGAHFRWDGLIAIIDANLLGQLPLRSMPAAFEGAVQHRLDIVASALLAPFVHPRIAIRLWGDALFDPVGTVLMAIGLAACGRAARDSTPARWALAGFLIVLCPAFVSPVDVVNVAYAVVLPVAAALCAGLGFVVVLAQFGGRVGVRAAVAATVAAIGVGGTLLFDVVNPRVLGASSYGIMFDTVSSEATDRVVALSYGAGFVRPTKTLYAGAIATFAGRRPVGYLEYDGGDLPAAELAAENKDLLFWSHGFDQDVAVADTICRTWPSAVLYEIWDRAHVSRVHAARIGATPWEPSAAAARWRSFRCDVRS